MITLYLRQGQAVAAAEVTAGDTVPTGTLWVDIYNPTPEEERSIEQQLGIQIPTHEEVWKNETLNRLYMENGVAYMTAALITKIDSPYPQTSAVTFILSRECLVTIRYIAPTSFYNFAHRIVRHPQHFYNGSNVLEGLLEEIITRVAYNSEIVVNELDKLSHDIFGIRAFVAEGKNSSQMMKEVLRRLGTCADLNSKISESLHSLSRMICFFGDIEAGNTELAIALRTLSTDAQALSQQTGFLADKVTFQLDATLGMINIEQNMIIKIFSVVAVFFMPPTLLSSIYGMNFSDMPELHWSYGYPLALSLMIMAAIMPFLYFRRKGWL